LALRDTWGPPDIIKTFNYPAYVYGVQHAVELAASLKLSKVASLELGVAGGNGLVALEEIAKKAADEAGIGVEVAGFDLGSGMPQPVDYRDTPYIWKPGFFEMDEAKLRSRLDRAQLFIGDVAETGKAYLAQNDAPLGFISFDLDYYSSTKAAMGALLEGPLERYLPRVFCYFDDTIGPHGELHSEFTGELLAIAEFNAEHTMRKIARIHGLQRKMHPIEAYWPETFFVMHLFDHPDYNTFVQVDANWQLALRD